MQDNRHQRWKVMKTSDCRLRDIFITIFSARSELSHLLMVVKYSIWTYCIIKYYINVNRHRINGADTVVKLSLSFYLKLRSNEKINSHKFFIKALQVLHGLISGGVICEGVTRTPLSRAISANCDLVNWGTTIKVSIRRVRGPPCLLMRCFSACIIQTINDVSGSTI